MVTGSPIAGEGASVAVLWHPFQRISPQPARRLGNYRTQFWLAVSAACARVFFVLLDALIDVRRVPIEGCPELCEDTAFAVMGSLLDWVIAVLYKRQ
jgi:hypothetical protein